MAACYGGTLGLMFDLRPSAMAGMVDWYSVCVCVCVY